MRPVSLIHPPDSPKLVALPSSAPLFFTQQGQETEEEEEEGSRGCLSLGCRGGDIAVSVTVQVDLDLCACMCVSVSASMENLLWLGAEDELIWSQEVFVSV